MKLLTFAVLSAFVLTPFAGATHPGTAPCGPSEIYVPVDSESNYHALYLVVSSSGQLLVYMESNAVNGLQRDDASCYHAGYDLESRDTLLGTLP